MPEFLHVLFSKVVKHSSVFFLDGLHFVFEKNEDKIACTMNATRWNKRFFYLFLLSFLKNSGKKLQGNVLLLD